MKILNCDFDSVGQQQFVNWMDELLRRGTRGHVATVDVSQLMEANSTAETSFSLGRSTLTLCGSRWIYWLSQLLRRPLQSYFTSDALVPIVCQSAISNKRSVFFIGSDRDSVFNVGKAMKKQFPELSISGIQHEHFEDEYSDEIVEWIRESGTGILVVDMESNTQSKFFKKYRNELDVEIVVQTPGAFDTLTGKPRRTKDLHVFKFIGYSMFELLVKAPFVDAWNKTKFNSSRVAN